MFYKKVLFALFFTFSIILLMLIGCAEDKQSSKEVPITTSSDEAMQLFIKGRDMFDKLKAPQAAEFFDKAIAIDKDFAMAYLYRAGSGGGYKIYRENLSKAYDLLDKVTEGEKHLILYNNADNSANQKVELDTLLSVYPEDKRVQELVGNYYYGLNDFTKALVHFNKAAKLDSNYAPIYNQLGYAHMGMENYTDAEAAFQKYIQLIPNDANPYDSFAEFLLMQGRYDESIEQYQKAFQTDSEFVSALLGIGNNYIFKKDFNKAREYYQEQYDKSFNINQKMNALWWKAVSFIYEGKINNAVNVFDERSKLAFDNNYPTAGITGYRFIALILADKGKLKDAENYLDKASKMIHSARLREEDQKAFNITIGLDRCYVQALNKDIKGAEKNLETVKQQIDRRQIPTETEYLNFVIGFIQFNKGQYDLALQNFKKSGTGNPYFWYWEANAQEKLGNKQAAKEMYGKVAKYNANSVGLALVRDRAKNKM